MKIVRWLGLVLFALVLAGLTFPRLTGLSMTTPVAQVVAFRGLLLAATAAALVLSLLWTTVRVVAWRRGRATASSVLMATVLSLLLAWSVVAHLLVLQSRGISTEHRATVEQVAAQPPAKDADFTVVSLNSQWDAVEPAWIAGLARVSHAKMIALPESELPHAQKVADELTRLGQPGWQVFASSSPWPNALLVSPEAGKYQLVDRGHRGLVIADPVDHEGPVLITVHAMPPPSVPPWNPTHQPLSAWWKLTVAEASTVIRSEPNVIAAGDFNATLDHAALDPGVRPAAIGSSGWGTWPSHWPSWAGARIDHVFAKPYDAVRGSWVVDVPGSDHRAVVAQLTQMR